LGTSERIQFCVNNDYKLEIEGKTLEDYSNENHRRTDNVIMALFRILSNQG